MGAGPHTRRFDWVYQVVAVCLLLLAASPFTAPFATCDVDHGVIHSLFDGDAGKTKISDDAAPVVGACIVSAPFASTTSVAGRHSYRVGRRADSAPIPLRI